MCEYKTQAKNVKPDDFTVVFFVCVKFTMSVLTGESATPRNSKIFQAKNAGDAEKGDDR